MRWLSSGRVIAGVLGAWLSMPGLAAASQDAPSPAVMQTLNRVAADLFSSSPDAEAAITELKTMLAAEPELAEGHMLLGIAYRVQGSPDLMGEAVAELRQAIALKPSLLLARLTLARVYMDMARNARAREELEDALEAAPGRPEVLALLGEVERQMGNPRRAVDLNRQALETDASFVQARYYLGLALLDLKQHADSIRELRAVVKSGDNPAEAYLGLGVAYLQSGRLDEGLAALRTAAKHDPSRPEIRLQLARAYRLKGMPDEALKELELARAEGPAGLGALYRNLEADVLMEEGLVRMQQGQFQEAAESFERVLAIDGSHAAAKQQLGEARKALKRQAPVREPGSGA